VEINSSKNDQLLQAALKGLSTRQQTIADNVANVDTPQFKASRVSFETELKQALGTGDQPLPMFKVTNGVAGPGDSSGDVKPTVTTESDTSRRNDGNNVDVDREMLDLTDTNMRYNAVISTVSSKLQILRYAINGGKA
jgi:flagellar basal-body rod protein FlgB